MCLGRIIMAIVILPKLINMFNTIPIKSYGIFWENFPVIHVIWKNTQAKNFKNH